MRGIAKNFGVLPNCCHLHEGLCFSQHLGILFNIGLAKLKISAHLECLWLEVFLLSI
jgi:hypothetical protein